jgi:hypothetical protein
VSSHLHFWVFEKLMRARPLRARFSLSCVKRLFFSWITLVRTRGRFRVTKRYDFLFLYCPIRLPERPGVLFIHFFQFEGPRLRRRTHEFMSLSPRTHEFMSQNPGTHEFMSPASSGLMNSWVPRAIFDEFLLQMKITRLPSHSFAR